MANKNKVRSYVHESEVVKMLKKAGYEDAVRAWGSNGNAFGEHREVDVKATIKGMKFKLQLKRKKVIPQWVGLSGEVDAAVVREDRGDNYIFLRLDKFLEVVK